MPRNRVQTGGPMTEFNRNPPKANEAFQKGARKQSSTKYFRNFYRTKTKAYMTTYDDSQFLAVYLFHMGEIYTAGDPQTAFNALIDKAWEIGAKTGNIKDLDTTNQEPNYKIWMQCWAYIAWEVMAQLRLRNFIPAFTESSVTATSTTALAIWTQSDWDAMLASLEKLDCPDFVYRFIEKFQFYVRMTESYEKAGIVIPPSYFVPGCHMKTLAQLQAIRETAKGVSANAMTHCKKFGIPFSKFSSSKLESKEVLRSDLFKSQDRIAFFCIAPFKYTWKTGPTVKLVRHSSHLTGANLTTDYTLIQYMFDDKQEMSIVHAMFPLFGENYDVTNNPYGEIFTTVDSVAGEYNINFFHTKNLGTAWTGGAMTGLPLYHIVSLFLAFWNSGAEYGLTWIGSEVTLTNIYTTVNHWPAFAENINLCKDTGHVAGPEALDSCCLAAKSMIYGD
jgi:hypothetical protein